MKITNRMLQEDIKNLAEALKSQEMEIPTSWECLKPGLAIFLGMILWQFFIVWPGCYTRYGAPFCDASIFCAGVAGFCIMFSSYAMRSRYLSLPENIRKNSLIITFLTRKMQHFALTYFGIFVFLGLITKIVEGVPFFPAGFVFGGFIIFGMAFSLDLGRYDLSLFNALITAWQSGKTPDLEELQKEITAEKIKKPEV